MAAQSMKLGELEFKPEEIGNMIADAVYMGGGKSDLKVDLTQMINQALRERLEKAPIAQIRNGFLATDRNPGDIVHTARLVCIEEINGEEK